MFKFEVYLKSLEKGLVGFETDSKSMKLVVDYYLNNLKKDINKFTEEIKDKITEPIPDIYKHRKRPSNRLWDYLVTGEMANSFKVVFVEQQLNSNVYRISVNFENTSPHSFFTNRLVGNQSGKWGGWFDDITKGDGREQVRSLNEVVRSSFDNSILENLILQVIRQKGSK